MVRGDKIIIDYGDDTVTYTYGSMSDGIGSYYVFCDENGQQEGTKVLYDDIPME